MQTTTYRKKAIIYCRVSTKEQVEEGNSLSSQERNCREYAIKNGLEVIKVFVEQGESAKTQNRTELKNLLVFCADKKNGVSQVLIYKIDRISRNTDDYSQIRILLKRYGVEIKSTTEYFENTPAGRFMENIISNVAQFDNDVRTERSVGGMRDAMKEGRYVWSAPIGYTNMRINGKSTIVPNAMAPIVKRTFELIAQNQMHVEDVRKLMDKEGLRNKKNKSLVRSYFYRMIRQEAYSGWIVKFGERHRGSYELIIPEELFQKVQDVIRKRGRKQAAFNRECEDFPLRRFVFHPSGRKLTGGWSKGRTKKYPYYFFPITGCNYKKDFLENKFKEFLQTIKLDDKQLGKVFKFYEANIFEGIKNQNKEREVINQKIEDLKVKQTILIQKNIDGFISDSVLRSQLEMMENQIFNLFTSISTKSEAMIDEKLLKSVFVTYFSNPGFIWQNLSFKSKVKMQWFNFPKGIIFDGANFRTNEIAFIYKLNESILDSQSTKVDSSSKCLNQNQNKIIEPLPITNDNSDWKYIIEREIEFINGLIKI